MEQTQEENKVMQTGVATSGDEKAESLKMVEVGNLLQGNLVRTTRLMWCQLFFIGAFMVFLGVAYFSLLNKIPSASNVAVLGPESLEKPSPAAEITSPPQVTPTEPAVRSTDIPERKEVQVVLDQVRKAQMEKDISLFLQAYSPTYPSRLLKNQFN